MLLGAAVGSAALIGALVVGDSVRESLRALALQRLGAVHFAMETGDRHFRARLAELTESGLREGGFRGSHAGFGYARDGSITYQSTGSNRLVKLTITHTYSVGPGWVGIFGTNCLAHVSPVLKLDATASTQGGDARANRVQLLGIGATFCPLANTDVFSNLPPDGVLLNEALAAQLRVTPGDDLIFRARKADGLRADSPLAPQDESAAVLRLRVHRILTATELGNFSLTANQVPPFNAFVALSTLQEKAGAWQRANLLVADLPVDVRWLPSRFSWRQWLGAWLKRPNLRFTATASGLRTNLVSSEEALDRLNHALDERLDLTDFQLRVTHANSRPDIELRSARVFLDPPIVDALFQAATNLVAKDRVFPTTPYGVLTYLANLIRLGDRATPYSMITAASPPLVPADLHDDEILINQWLAEDLNASPGSEIEVSWFAPDQAAQLLERTNRFRVRAVLPMDHPALDRSLMPDFPGIAGAEKAGDWHTGFPLKYKIREKDDDYWKKYRGTPKAFITLAAGQRLWANRFGNLTAVRFPFPAVAGDPFGYLHQSQIELALRRLLTGSTNLQAELGPAANPAGGSFDPASLGFRFKPVREQALAASSQSEDFGGLFLGFSFFLIVAALILMALLFQFGLEQRTAEIGTLLALGFPPGRVRRLLLWEGTTIALLGGLLGAFGGLVYAWTMVRALTTIWRDAVGTASLGFHFTLLTLATGVVASVLVSAITIWFVLRKQARRPARELLAQGADLKSQISNFKSSGLGPAHWIAPGAGAAALALIGWAVWQGDSASAETFFSAGALLLVAELAAVALLLSALGRSEATRRLSLAAMGLRSCTRRRTRSLASVALLACGSFLVVAVGANRLDAGREATKRSSGTGGFALFGESTLPVIRDLNTQAGREFYGLEDRSLPGVSVVPFRVRDGDDASCLNLNRAQNPRLLGVRPELLAERGAFTFAKVLKGLPADKPWMLLRSEAHDRKGTTTTTPEGGTTNDLDAIPAIGDAASIQWALGKKLGDTITYTDERGQPFKVRLVAGVANSILQGNLIIDEAEFVKRFPSESGYRLFLIDTSSRDGTELEKISATLSRALQDVGFEVTPATRRLAAFNAVQNTYLNTFQVLGGLGLLLGSAGLGVVVLRNVLERRGELGLLQAVGFRRRSLQWLVLSEHGGLLMLGLGVGLTAALAAILPVLLAPGAELHSLILGATLAGVLASGLLWTWCATRLALRGELLNALRNE